MSREQAYRAATLRAQEARAQFLGSVDVAKQRIAPARLKTDIKDRIGQTANNAGARVRAAAHEHPIAAGAAGLAFVAFLFRRPLTALFGRLYVRFTNRNPETDDG